MLAGVDARIRFSLEPLPGDDAFQQWHDAMRAVARLPLGIPPEFRKKVPPRARARAHTHTHTHTHTPCSTGLRLVVMIDV